MRSEPALSWSWGSLRWPVLASTSFCNFSSLNLLTPITFSAKLQDIFSFAETTSIILPLEQTSYLLGKLTLPPSTAWSHYSIILSSSVWCTEYVREHYCTQHPLQLLAERSYLAPGTSLPKILSVSSLPYFSLDNDYVPLRTSAFSFCSIKRSKLSSVTVHTQLSTHTVVKSHF